MLSLSKTFIKNENTFFRYKNLQLIHFLNSQLYIGIILNILRFIIYILTKYGAIIRYILAMENNVAKKKYIYMEKMLMIAMFAKIFIF